MLWVNFICNIIGELMQRKLLLLMNIYKKNKNNTHDRIIQKFECFDSDTVKKKNLLYLSGINTGFSE